MTAPAPLRVLVTRPRLDAEETARLLTQRGIDSVIAPLIEIGETPSAARDLGHELSDAQAVLVTSANGARALARATAKRDVSIFAVGDASADVARQSGFSDVSSASGDVSALAALVCERLDPKAGTLVHAAGSAVAGDLASDLTNRGFAVRRVQLYQAQLVDRLPENARSALQDELVDGVLFYSPRTGRHFAKLISAAGLQPSCRRIFAGCLSAAVADAIAELPFAEIRTAERPDQTALFSTLAAGK